MLAVLSVAKHSCNAALYDLISAKPHLLCWRKGPLETFVATE